MGNVKNMAKNEMLVPYNSHRIMCVKVGKVKRESLYEMTRKYWKASLQRASGATHVLAIIDGIVEAVYLPKSWEMTEEMRIMFEGVEDIDSDYIGKCVDAFYGKSQNPVKYINM